ncbi:MAG: hypothetical protein Q9M28_06785 [Mariprofundaceae bacterium]|nr:hypothetical protein [Mariprofundaceae bacterium]
MSKSKVPCPFCGMVSVGVLSPKTTPNASSHKAGFQAECINCGARGPCHFETARFAILAWEYGDSGQVKEHLEEGIDRLKELKPCQSQ